MLAVASDHAGYSLKCEIIKHLDEKGISYEDLGTFDGEKSVDYPDYGQLVENPWPMVHISPVLLYVVQALAFRSQPTRCQA